MPPDPPPKPQIDKFRELARQLETDDDEARFDERLKKLAGAPKPKRGYWQVHQVPGGHMARFVADAPHDTYRDSPIYPTPQDVYGWLTALGCKPFSDDGDKWRDS
jgi:hypothetical protein